MFAISEAVLICTFIAVTAAAGVPLWWMFGRDRSIDRRIDDLRDPHAIATRNRFMQSRRNAEETIVSTLANFGSRLMPGSEVSRMRLMQKFLHAGIYSPASPSIFTSVRFVLGLILPIIIMLAAQLHFLDKTLAIAITCVCVCVGFLGTSAWLKSRVAQRQRSLRQALPDFLDLTGTCLQAGQSLEAAISRVTDELRTAHPNLAVELMIVEREMTVGSSPAKALRNFSERSGLDVIRQLSTLVDQSQRFGTSMSESLQVHAEMLRTQRSQRAETLAHKAGVKILIPTLLFIFPPVLVILVGPAAIDLHEKFVSDHGVASANSR